MTLSTVIGAPVSHVAPSATQGASRLLAMDGLRGIAALAVVLLHSKVGLVNNGGLAVDFFFILSGFVVAFAYDHRLAEMGWWRFFQRRMHRLYPMIFVGAVGGLAIGVLRHFLSSGGDASLFEVIRAGALAIFLLPNLFDDGINDYAFTYNLVMWSLFFEVLVNLFYAVFFRFMSVRNICLVIGLAFLLSFTGNGEDSFTKAGFAWGACSAFTGFFLGVLVFRLHRRGWIVPFSVPFPVLAAILLAVLFFPVKLTGGLYYLTLALFVAMLACSINSPSVVPDRILNFLGEISYPVYLIHWLTLFGAAFVFKQVLDIEKYYPLFIVLHFLTVPVLALLVSRWFDIPVRRATARFLR